MEHFIEIQNWGNNLLTQTFVASIAFATIRTAGVLLQAGKIVWKRSAQKVFVPLYMSLCLLGIAAMPYGYQRAELGITLNGLLVFCSALPVVLATFWFRDRENPKWYKRFAIVAAVLTCIVIAAIALQSGDTLIILTGAVLVTGLATFVPLGIQAAILFRSGKRGDVSVVTFILVLAGSLLWLAYSYYASDVPFAGLMILQAVMVSITIIAWLRAEPDEITPQ